ncbi:hypothetical protein DFH27DRAFT_548602 [Peziza echinospora]|nr:hypothetical protein DFH27DRAFT_548602 [Peziza echinospora]
MDDHNTSSNTSRSLLRPPTFTSSALHSTRSGNIRRRHMARNGYSLEARRRRSSGLMSGEGGNSDTSAGPSPGKRRKLEPQYAQSEIAPIDLKLLSCDGGKYKTTTAKPSSVLQQNNEVYCTEGSICNMVFEQVDDQCFTLERMVIQGPLTGYTSPVQEGYIFVTMDDNDFAKCYNYPFPSSYNASDDEDDHDEDQDDWGAEPEISDDDFQPNETDNPLAEPSDTTPPVNSGSPQSNSQAGNSQNTTLQMEPAARFKIHKDGNGNNMKATLTFEPALTGRYIVARFFSPKKKKNIDIQFIGAYGYVGRRFFPSRTPR